MAENHLTQLPPLIANLSSLQTLRCEENNLKELPPEIGQLRELRERLDNPLLDGAPPDALLTIMEIAEKSPTTPLELRR